LLDASRSAIKNLPTWLLAVATALTLTGLPSAGTALAQGEGPVITVTETIGVEDAPAAHPPVAIDVVENVEVADAPQALPPVAIGVTEAIGVADTPAAIPPVVIDVAEEIGVSDVAQVLPPLSIDVTESIGVTDVPGVLAPVVIDVVEDIGVSDAPRVLAPVVIDVAETIGVSDDVQTSVPDPDADDDGVDDAIEAAAPNGGDGNDDGTPDHLQPSVASLPDAGGLDYVTVEVAPGCARLLDVAMAAEPELPVQDPAWNYPFGLLGLRLPCTTATVTALFHGATSLAGPYRNFGPTAPGDPGTTAWYTLPSAAFGTATVGGSTVASVTLALADGVLGDETGIDGEILTRGGPAVAAPPVPTLSPIGLLALMLMLVIAAASRLALGSRPGLRGGPSTRRKELPQVGKEPEDRSDTRRRR